MGVYGKTTNQGMLLKEVKVLLRSKVEHEVGVLSLGGLRVGRSQGKPLQREYPVRRPGVREQDIQGKKQFSMA